MFYLFLKRLRYFSEVFFVCSATAAIDFERKICMKMQHPFSQLFG